MIYVSIVLLLVAVVLFFMWQNAAKALAKEQKEHQDLLDHYQIRVDEQERTQNDFRELQKNFESVGEGYDQALLMYDKMQEESEKLKRANEVIQQQNTSLQQALDTARQTAQRATECIKQTAESVSRELSVLVGNTEASKVAARIAAVLRNAQNLADLKEDRPIEHTDNVMLMDVADKAVADSGILNVSYLHFEKQAEGGAEATMVLTNTAEAARVVTLLLDNVIKFVSGGKVVLRVVADMDKSQVRYEVEDCGTGIPADEAEHVFDPFVKLNSFFDGQGIGLTVARSVARRLGGDLLLDSGYTGGARFVFNLPLS